jgi:hypothetical protein
VRGGRGGGCGPISTEGAVNIKVNSDLRILGLCFCEERALLDSTTSASAAAVERQLGHRRVVRGVGSGELVVLVRKGGGSLQLLRRSGSVMQFLSEPQHRRLSSVPGGFISEDGAALGPWFVRWQRGGCRDGDRDRGWGGGESWSLGGELGVVLDDVVGQPLVVLAVAAGGFVFCEWLGLGSGGERRSGRLTLLGVGCGSRYCGRYCEALSPLVVGLVGRPVREDKPTATNRS